MSKPDKVMKRTLVDRFVGYLSPERGLNRMRARATIQRALTFEGASKGRRTKNWKPSNDSINAGIVDSLPTLRARSRDLTRNNAWAAGAIDSIVAETIGAGIIPQARDQDETFAKRVDNLWKAWGDETVCDADNLLDFYGIQALAMKTIAEAGSVLIRRRTRRLTDGFPLPLQLQVLEPEYLDTSKDTFGALSSSGTTVMGGVEFDRIGRRRGYWIFKEHPSSRLSLRAQESVFVPASEILHIFRVDRAGQVDGYPWVAPVIITLRDLDDFEDHERVRQKVAACMTAFRTQQDPLEDQAALTQAQREELAHLEPGAVEVLGPGENMVFSTPPASNGYGVFVPWQLRAIARAFGVTYEACTGDFSQVNFSSGRMGRLQMNRNIQRWQQQIIIPRLCKTVWAWAMDAAMIAGLLPRPCGAVWSVPKVEMIDPAKETAAIKEKIRAGISTLSEEIRQSGRDPADVFDERQKDDAELDRRGIVVDSDPRQDKQASSGFAASDDEEKEGEEKEALAS